MSVSLSSSKEITVNKINLIQPNGTVNDLMTDVISNIEGGLAEGQLQTVSDISNAINNDPNFLKPIFKFKLTINKNIKQLASKPNT